MTNKTLTYCLYAVLALLLIYFIYTNYICSEDSDDDDDEVQDFDNNSSVRSDYGDDKNFDKLSLRDKVAYIKDKQKRVIENYTNQRQRSALMTNMPY